MVDHIFFLSFGWSVLNRFWISGSIFEGSGNVLGTRRSDGSSKPGMSCGEDVAEASMRDRG